MFDTKEQATKVTDLTVQDAWVALQLLEKAAANGVIQPTEFEVLSTWRGNLVAAIEAVVDKNFDAEALRLQQERLAEQQAAQDSALADHQTHESSAA